MLNYPSAPPALDVKSYRPLQVGQSKTVNKPTPKGGMVQICL